MPKILLIRFSSIGDIVLTSPVTRVLRKQLNAELHFLTKSPFVDLVQWNPHISKVHTLQSSLSDTIKALKSESFDLIVDLHKNLRSKRIISSLGIKSYDFDKLNWEKWLMVNFKIDRLGSEHIVDRYFRGLGDLAVKNDGLGLDYFFSKEIGESLPSELAGWLAGRPYLALAIGAAHATKQMPEQLLSAIIDKSKYPIVILGGKGERELGEGLAESHKEKVLSLCGKTDLSGSARIIEKCLALICPDTGMMHIGAALKKPVVAIWGNTIPEFGMYPYYPKGESQFTNIEQPGLSCRPCSKIGKKKCPKGHFDCMLKHRPEKILEAAYSLIN